MALLIIITIPIPRVKAGVLSPFPAIPMRPTVSVIPKTPVITMAGITPPHTKPNYFVGIRVIHNRHSSNNLCLIDDLPLPLPLQLVVLASSNPITHNHISQLLLSKYIMILADIGSLIHLQR